MSTPAAHPPTPAAAAAAVANAADSGSLERAVQMLQDQQGNRGTSELLRRVVQRQDTAVAPADASARRLVVMALTSRSTMYAKWIPDYRAATEDERFELMEILLDQGWVGPSDERALERLWNTFGDRLPVVAEQHWGLFSRCLDRGAELYDISAARALRRKFERDVKQTAKRYLVDNRTFVDAELERLGLRGQGADTEQQRADQQQRAAELQEIARLVADARAAREALQEIPVGYNTYAQTRVAYTGGGAYSMPTGQVTKVTAKFHPSRRPMQPPGPDDRHMQAWEAVNEQWNAASSVIAATASLSPAVYGALQQGRLDELLTSSPASARTTLGQVLGELRGNITATLPKIDDGDLDWRDLHPIHRQLFGGQEAPSGTDWSAQFAQGVAKDIVADHQDRQFWIALGLGSLAAAAFVVAAIASGGAAVALVGVGLAAGGTQAAISWEQYEDLRTAARSAGSSDTELVDQAQVDAALLSAVLDSVFVFLDAAGVAARALRVATAARGVRLAGRQAAALDDLARVGQLGAAEARGAVEQGIRELGVAETLRRTGKSPRELAELLGDSALREQVERYAATISSGESGIIGWLRSIGRASRVTGDLRRSLRTLAEDLKLGRVTQAQADEMVGNAIDVLGPRQTIENAGGWKALASTLGNESRAGQRLYAWRDALYEDLKTYVERELGGEIKRTGRAGQFTNDLDVSLLGENAAANREKVLQFMAGRTGVPANKLEKLLLFDAFTDPRRLHMYDEIADPALRAEIARKAAAREQELIWARRLHDAGDDEALQRALRHEMAELGIAEVPFRQLTESQLGHLAQRVDALYTQFAAAKRAGDTAAQARIADQIATNQAMIEASRGGGYFSGGGGRRFVTERDAIGGYGTAATAPALPAQQLTAIVDQLPKLDEAVRALTAATRPDEVAGALKKVGKYGDRLSGAAGDALQGVPGSAVFDGLADAFRSVVADVESGAVQRMTIAQVQRLAREIEGPLRVLNESSSAFMQRLRQTAGVEGLEGGMEAIQRAARGHIMLLRATDSIHHQITALLRLAAGRDRVTAAD